MLRANQQSDKKQQSHWYLIAIALLSIGSLSGCVYCIPSLMVLLSIPLLQKLTRNIPSIQHASSI